MKRSFNPFMLLLLLGILYTLYMVVSTHGERDYQVVKTVICDSVGDYEETAGVLLEGGDELTWYGNESSL